MSLIATICLDDERIRNAFDAFVARMSREVLESFNGFLTEITQVKTLPSNKDYGVGVCEFSIGGNSESKVAVRIAHERCGELSHPGLIGVFAHEFGYVEDRLFNGDNAETYEEDAEATANENAICWGFKAEIHQLYQELGFAADEIPLEPASVTKEAIEVYWAISRPMVMKNIEHDRNKRDSNCE